MARSHRIEPSRGRPPLLSGGWVCPSCALQAEDEATDAGAVQHELVRMEGVLPEPQVVLDHHEGRPRRGLQMVLEELMREDGPRRGTHRASLPA